MCKLTKNMIRTRYIVFSVIVVINCHSLEKVEDTGKSVALREVAVQQNSFAKKEVSSGKIESVSHNITGLNFNPEKTSILNRQSITSCSSTVVTGSRMGLKFSGCFIAKQDTLILHMKFENVSNRKIVFFPPFYYGNQGIKTLGFVQVFIPDSIKSCIGKNGLYVTAFRSFCNREIAPGETVVYRYFIGNCTKKNENRKLMPFRLEYAMSESTYVHNKSKLDNYSDLKNYWFGNIITTTGYFCCDSITLENALFLRTDGTEQDKGSL